MVNTPQDTDDAIFGSLDNDFISVGNSNDVVIAGNGDDYLEGGSGTDTYIYTEGNDIILDSDGLGNINWKGQVLTGISLNESNSHVDDDNGIRYLFEPDASEACFELTGANKNDHIYGGADNDWLVGQGFIEKRAAA